MTISFSASSPRTRSRRRESEGGEHATVTTQSRPEFGRRDDANTRDHDRQDRCRYAARSGSRPGGQATSGQRRPGQATKRSSSPTSRRPSRGHEAGVPGRRVRLSPRRSPAPSHPGRRPGTGLCPGRRSKSGDVPAPRDYAIARPTSSRSTRSSQFIALAGLPMCLPASTVPQRLGIAPRGGFPGAFPACGRLVTA